MAQIRQFVPRNTQEDNHQKFRDKIKKRRRFRLARLFIYVIAIVIACFFIYQYVRNISYSSYTRLSSMSRSGSDDSQYMDHNGRVLTYSKDGISSMDSQGNIIWNETYQMQNPIVRVNENAVAVGDYNGNVIYIMDENGKVGEVDTNLPIRDFCVSKTGVVAVVLKDSGLMRLNLYNASGTELVKSESRMDQNGYPLALALSDSGEVMGVSYLYVDSGEMKSSVAFYNFSDVGQNSVDRLVSGNDYADTIVPYVGFLSKDSAFAVGDNRISFYSGEEKPVSVAEKLLSEEILNVYSGGEHVVLIYPDTTGAGRYRMEVYDKKGALVMNQNIDIDFQHILVEKNYLLLYNEGECVMYTMQGREKYRGVFAQKARLMIPLDRGRRFIMVTSDSIDTIELN